LPHISSSLFAAGLYCRTDDRGDPAVVIAPPLISGPAEFEIIETTLRSVLTEASHG
jgi:adenosylmethionine-8-amino-7-oxononanoate aminotransferase